MGTKAAYCGSDDLGKSWLFEQLSPGYRPPVQRLFYGHVTGE
jgi:hypothetical protein